MIDPMHGTGPHIDLSTGKGSQSSKDVWMNPHSEEAAKIIAGIGMQEDDKQGEVAPKQADPITTITPEGDEKLVDFRNETEDVFSFSQNLSSVQASTDPNTFYDKPLNIVGVNTMEVYKMMMDNYFY